MDVNDAEEGVRNLTDCITLAILRDLAAGANKDVAEFEASYYRVCWSSPAFFLAQIILGCIQAYTCQMS